jgi:hypothetical protein
MLEMIGGPDRDRTDDLFHAMEARSQQAQLVTMFEQPEADSFCTTDPDFDCFLPSTASI